MSSKPANDKTTDTALLTKVRENPELKELGENMIKTRRSLKGEMIFELKKERFIREEFGLLENRNEVPGKRDGGRVQGFG